tara:strand:- start:332 stop:1666 length:1335 start_codon:yes stop_codon:yes gene_type:complete
MPKNRKLQNIIGTEHITDAAEAAIAAQASGGATVAFKNVAVAGQDNIVADAATDTFNVAAGNGITLTTTAGTDTLTVAAAGYTYTATDGSEQFLISDTSDTALVKIVQAGTGAALQVHDQASDSSILQVNAAGTVAIGHTDAGGGGYGKLQVNGVTYSNQHASLAGSASGPGFTFGNDQNTGMFSGGTDIIGFSTGGTERLAIGAAGEVLIGGTAAGTSGQVLTSGGDGAAVTWAAAGGSSQISHTPQLAVDLFGAASSLVTVYPLIASGQSANDTTSDQWNDNVSTTTLFLWPCIAAKTGTINGLQLRTGASAGDNLHIGLYKSDDNGLPNGAAVFTNTISTATNTSFTPTISVSGVTKGDILYFATFGQSNRTNLRVIDVSDGGTFVVGRGISSVNYSAGGNAQIIQLSGQTNGSFPTLSSSTQYTGVGEPDFVPRIGITYS